MDRAATPSPSGVFISYRRQDTAPYARLLREELSKRLGSQQVFMDVDSIQVGVDFAEAINRAVGTCQVLLALVGPHWLTVADAEGQRRLDDPDDTVRLEIEAALTRNIFVIPVLVDNTPMPRRHQLPESLAPLARRNALELTYNRYAYDLGRLVEVVERVVGETTSPGLAPPASASESSSLEDSNGIGGTVTTTAGSPAPGRAARSDSVSHPFDLAALSDLVDDRSNDELTAVIQQQEGGIDGVLGKVFAGMAKSFNPAKAAGQQATVQYEITAPDGTHEWAMQVIDRTCRVEKGRAESPRATMRVGLPDFLRLVTGKANGMKLFMTGRVKISGDLFLVQTYASWFDPIAG